MKKFIVLIVFVVSGIIVFSSCSAQEKCPAYGHVSQYENSQASQNDI
jgi:hypothetical protein